MPAPPHPEARLYVRLDVDTFDALVEQARAERRDPRDQAAVLLERAVATRPGSQGQKETEAPSPPR